MIALGIVGIYLSIAVVIVGSAAYSFKRAWTTNQREGFERINLLNERVHTENEMPKPVYDFQGRRIS